MNQHGSRRKYIPNESLVETKTGKAGHCTHYHPSFLPRMPVHNTESSPRGINNQFPLSNNLSEQGLRVQHSMHEEFKMDSNHALIQLNTLRQNKKSPRRNRQELYELEMQLAVYEAPSYRLQETFAVVKRRVEQAWQDIMYNLLHPFDRDKLPLHQSHIKKYVRKFFQAITPSLLKNWRLVSEKEYLRLTNELDAYKSNEAHETTVDSFAQHSSQTPKSFKRNAALSQEEITKLIEKYTSQNRQEIIKEVVDAVRSYNTDSSAYDSGKKLTKEEEYNSDNSDHDTLVSSSSESTYIGRRNNYIDMYKVRSNDYLLPIHPRERQISCESIDTMSYEVDEFEVELGFANYKRSFNCEDLQEQFEKLQPVVDTPRSPGRTPQKPTYHLSFSTMHDVAEKMSQRYQYMAYEDAVDDDDDDDFEAIRAPRSMLSPVLSEEDESSDTTNNEVESNLSAIQMEFEPESNEDFSTLGIFNMHLINAKRSLRKAPTVQ